MSTYATFRENNAWEGEVWRHYIPIEGNEGALSTLASILSDRQDTGYSLDVSPLDEATVDARVARPHDCGYMAAHTKLSGRLVLPGKPLADDDWLYKGGIADLVGGDDA
ncbi:MAG TPA: hypothetical protein VGW74_10560 [Propionibacteriaceae bacterium]|nr:hypothetical protein [Propionibacteriaceae bacterium]